MSREKRPSASGTMKGGKNRGVGEGKGQKGMSEGRDKRRTDRMKGRLCSRCTGPDVSGAGKKR